MVRCLRFLFWPFIRCVNEWWNGTWNVPGTSGYGLPKWPIRIERSELVSHSAQNQLRLSSDLPKAWKYGSKKWACWWWWKSCVQKFAWVLSPTIGTSKAFGTFGATWGEVFDGEDKMLSMEKELVDTFRLEIDFEMALGHWEWWPSIFVDLYQIKPERARQGENDQRVIWSKSRTGTGRSGLDSVQTVRENAIIFSPDWSDYASTKYKVTEEGRGGRRKKS